MKRLLTTGAAALALLLLLAGSANAADEGAFVSLSAERNGVVSGTVEADIVNCEREIEGFPCGGHLIVVAMPPTLGIRHQRKPAPAACVPKLDGLLGFWSQEPPRRWFGYAWGGYGEPRNPPERIVWMGPTVQTAGPQGPLSFRFRSKRQLWPRQFVDEPCLYLAYIYEASGEEPVDECLPGVDEDLREDLCEKQYWAEPWVTKLDTASVRGYRIFE